MRERVFLFPSNAHPIWGKAHRNLARPGVFPPNERRTDDGTISVALAARHSDPYSGADLVLWWPSLAAPPAWRDRHDVYGPVSATLVSVALRCVPHDKIRLITSRPRRVAAPAMPC